MSEETTKPFAAEVWETLSAINVNDHVEVLEKKKKNDNGQWRVVARIKYLSWTWAWKTLMDHYPESTVVYDEPRQLSDGTVEVWCTVNVISGDKQFSRQCWLPVMDNSNKAMRNPDARAISDTRQRCLVKCIALHGLGLYIYAGEDLPSEEKDKASEEAEKLAKAKAQEKAEEQQQRLADLTAKLEECADKKTLRTELSKARHTLNAEYWDKLVAWGTVRAKELPEGMTLAGDDVNG